MSPGRSELTRCLLSICLLLLIPCGPLQAATLDEKVLSFNLREPVARSLLADYLGFPAESLKDGRLSRAEVVAMRYRPEAIRALTRHPSGRLDSVDAARGALMFVLLRHNPARPGILRTVEQARRIFRRLTGLAGWRGRERELYLAAILRSRPLNPPIPSVLPYAPEMYINGAQMFPVNQLPIPVRGSMRYVTRVVGLRYGRPGKTGTGVFVRWNKGVVLISARHVVDEIDFLRYRVPGESRWVRVKRQDILGSPVSIYGVHREELGKKGRVLVKEIKKIDRVFRLTHKWRAELLAVIKSVDKLVGESVKPGLDPVLAASLKKQLSAISLRLNRLGLSFDGPNNNLKSLVEQKLLKLNRIVQLLKLSMFDFVVIPVPKELQQQIGGVQLAKRLPGPREHMFAIGWLPKLNKRAVVCLKPVLNVELIMSSRCSLKHGFSGGPMFDRHGRLVAVNFSSHLKRQLSFSVALSAPITALTIVQALRRQKTSTTRAVRPFRFALGAYSTLGLREHAFLIAGGVDIHLIEAADYWVVRLGATFSKFTENKKWYFGGAIEGGYAFRPSRRVLVTPVVELEYNNQHRFETNIGITTSVAPWDGGWVGFRVSLGLFILMPREDQKTSVLFNISSGLAFGASF